AESLRLLQRGLDTTVLDERRGKVGEKSFAVLLGDAERVAVLAVAHGGRSGLVLKRLEILLGGVEEALVELHAKRQAERLELVLDLVERLLAEVAVLEHLLLALHGELADGGDVGVVEAVRGADRKLDLVDAHVEQLAQLV